MTLSLFLAAALAQSVTFPLRPSDNARYLVDAANNPFPLLGRSSWFLALLSPADQDLYLADSARRGVNTVEFALIGHDPRGRHVPFNHAGHAPFLRRLDGQPWSGSLNVPDETPDFTTPNENYWRDLDATLARCQRQGFLALVFPAYVGYNGTTAQGWMKVMERNGPDRLRKYGAWVAQRYHNQHNIVWMLGGDHGQFNPTQTAVELALIEGLGGKKLRSAEWNSETIATDDPDFGRFITVNGAYSFDGYAAHHARRAYARTPVMPAFYLEGPYDEEHTDGTNVNPHATQPVRRFQWWGWLGSIGGHVAGNGYVWPFRDETWKQHLDTRGAKDMAILNAFVASLPWHTLVPSALGGQRELIIKDGSHERAPDYIAAAAALDGSLLVAYIPPDRSGGFTVDLTVMRGPACARWLDPTSGAYRAAANALSSTHRFTTPGKNAAGDRDWVLVLDAPAPTY